MCAAAPGQSWLPFVSFAGESHSQGENCNSEFCSSQIWLVRGVKTILENALIPFGLAAPKPASLFQGRELGDSAVQVRAPHRTEQDMKEGREDTQVLTMLSEAAAYRGIAIALV
jgi:hypothetical protein